MRFSEVFFLDTKHHKVRSARASFRFQFTRLRVPGLLMTTRAVRRKSSKWRNVHIPQTELQAVLKSQTTGVWGYAYEWHLLSHWATPDRKLGFKYRLTSQRHSVPQRCIVFIVGDIINCYISVYISFLILLANYLQSETGCGRKSTVFRSKHRQHTMLSVSEKHIYPHN